MKKTQNMHVWLREMVLAQHNCLAYGGLVKGTAAMMCTCRKECNKYDLSIIMIGLSGLLLVVPHLFAVPVLVLWVGLQKSI
jgi:hypothetical protein